MPRSMMSAPFRRFVSFSAFSCPKRYGGNRFILCAGSILKSAILVSLRASVSIITIGIVYIRRTDFQSFLSIKG